MRVGLQVFGTRTGLGYQTRTLYRCFRPAKTMLIDLSAAKGLPLAEGWYGPEVTRVEGVPALRAVKNFLNGIDLVFCCETPLNYRMFTEARWRGIATVLQFNPEFLDALVNPELPAPTVLAAPTTWLIDRAQAIHPNVWPLPAPIDPTGLPSRTVTRVKTIAHIAGQPTTENRNGTHDYIAAARACRDLDVEWALYCQVPNPAILNAIRGTGINLIREVPEPGDLYQTADLIVLPRRYGGQCLPALEALACGIPVLMPDVPPNRDLLPPAMLTQASYRNTTRGGYPPVPVPVHHVTVPVLAARIRALVADPAEVARLASEAATIGTRYTWDTLQPAYQECFTRAKELRP